MKTKRNYPYIFQIIAPIYGLFYRSQKRNFMKQIHTILDQSVIQEGQTILDVGCGTGSLSSALSEFGFSVTGVDPVRRMLQIARKKDREKKVNYVLGNVLDGLNVDSKLYDISIASYVAHGLKKQNRLKMYQEMKRVTKDKILFIDYNQNRNFFISLIERLERGDYFNYIKEVETELTEYFNAVSILPLNKHFSLYICEI